MGAWCCRPEGGGVCWDLACQMTRETASHVYPSKKPTFPLGPCAGPIAPEAYESTAIRLPRTWSRLIAILTLTLTLTLT